jgi:ribonucleoside-diphosphate reductase alpha chain
MVAAQDLPELTLTAVYSLAQAEVVVASLMSQEHGTEVYGPTISVPDQDIGRAPSAPDPAAERSIVIYSATSRQLPKSRSSRTTSFTVGGAEGVITAGEFEDGEIGEIRIGLGKQGSTLAGVFEGFNVIVSLALQYGVPLERMVEKLTNLSFEPNGLTDDPDVRMAKSLFDYMFRRLALDYLGFNDRARLGIYSAEERQRFLENGSYSPPEPQDPVPESD